jgi:hypothetical protein
MTFELQIAEPLSVAKHFRSKMELFSGDSKKARARRA